MLKASLFSKNSFLQWARKGYFQIRGTKIYVGDVEIKEFTLEQDRQCKQCRRIWDASKILQEVERVQWDKVSRSKGEEAASVFENLVCL